MFTRLSLESLEARENPAGPVVIDPLAPIDVPPPPPPPAIPVEVTPPIDPTPVW